MPAKRHRAVFPKLGETQGAQSPEGTAKLEEHDRFTALGYLAAGIAHEVNNPLAYVLANLRSIDDALATMRATDDSTHTTGELQALLTEAREGMERVATIVRDLSVFSRPRDDEREVLAIEDVLDATTGLLRHELRRRATVLREYGDTRPVLVSRVRLGQVFLNLLLNAIHALPSGAETPARIMLRTRTAGGYTTVEVEDTGVGISAAHLERIFDPYFTTKDGLGTGLGLPISLAIVTSFGGSIEVESAEGAGTLFRVVLPIADMAPRLPSLRPMSIPPRRSRILVVDDEMAVGRALVRIVGKDHDTQLITSGREALDHLRADPGYDVVFCDVSMPDLGGADLRRLVLQFDKALASRFVFVTGGASTDEARVALERAGCPVLSKPYDPSVIRAAIRTALAGRLQDAGESSENPGSS